MNASDFPGLACECGETPSVSNCGPTVYGDNWSVWCFCGRCGPFRRTAPLAVQAWEAGHRNERLQNLIASHS